MKTKHSFTRLFKIPLTAALLAAGLASTGLAQVTLSTTGKLPMGTAARPGFRWFSYQVGPLVGGLANQNVNAEGALIGLFGGTTVGTNIANLSGAGSQGYFNVPGVINFNGDPGDIGSFPGDTAIPGVPGITFNGDNIAAECLTYVEFTAPGLYTMGVNSDDGFRVTEGLARPSQAMVLNSPASVAGPVGCSLPANIYSAGGFGGPLPSIPLTAELVLADPILAGTPLVNAAAVAGKICVVDRGTFGFAVKAKVAQDAGAIAIIIINQNNPTTMPIAMGGAGATVTIPAAMIVKSDGDRIKAALALGPVTMSLGGLGGVELGTFNGGRGAADTTFTFTVPEAGLYPMRLLWYQGGGGKNVEWFTVDGSSVKHLLNNAADSASLRAFQGALVVNWASFNEHAPSASTAPNVTTYNMRGWVLAADPGTAFPLSGPLTNFTTSVEYPSGSSLLAQYEASTRTRSPDLFPNATLGVPDPGTPAYDLFLPGGVPIVDLANAGSSVGLGSVPAGELLGSDTVVLTFKNLNPSMLYNFRGTVVRNGVVFGGNHPGRWTYCTIESADAFTDAHTAGCLTSKTPLPGFTRGNGRVFPPLALVPGQVIFQTGLNTQGNMIGYDGINPGSDGSFSIVARAWAGVVTNLYLNMPPASPAPTITNAYDSLGYALTATMLQEVGVSTPVWVTRGPGGTNALQSLPFTLSVYYAGTAPHFQWHKVGVGAIVGATEPSYTVPVSQIADAGDYFVILNNSFSSFTSTVAHVEVIVDTTRPAVVSANAGAGGAFDQVLVQFSERVDLSEAVDIFNYTIDGGVGQPASAAIVSPGSSSEGTAVNLTFAASLTENTVYHLVVTGIHDIAGNVTDGAVMFPFRTWVVSIAGGVSLQLYTGIGGNAVAALTTHPSFPNSPTVVAQLTSFNTREFLPTDSLEGYGGRMRALFIPPSSGNWTFYLRSDDASELYLNPASPAATGKVLLTAETGCCGAFAGHASLPRSLTAGQAYYLEALYKEGTGGDYCQVAVKRSSDPTDPNTLTPIPGTMLGYAAPPGAAGEIGITQQPANITTNDNQSVTFSVVATNTYLLPMLFQWMTNGVEVTGANGPSYTFVARVADHITQVSVQASIVGAKVLSTPATLVVVPDSIPPLVLSVSPDGSFTHITVVFNELMNEATATDLFGYALDGPSAPGFQTITLQPNGRTVVITLDATMQVDSDYRLAIITPSDLAGNPVAEGTTNIFRTWKLAPGYLTFQTFTTAGGNAVADLINHPNYPSNPRETFYLNAFDTRLVYPDNSHEAYGGRMSGVFIPPTSGNWILYLSSDDSSELYLNPTGYGADGKMLMTAETGCCNGFAAHPSAAQALVGGQQYFIEALYKEGTGGDFCRVAAKLESDPTDPNLLSAIPSGSLGTYLNPVGSSLTITKQATDQAGVVPSVASALLSQNFNANDGGFTVINNGAPELPWAYDAPSGTWRSGFANHVADSSLTSPTLTVTKPGVASISLSHRHSFEFDTPITAWDGGVIQLSVNGGPYAVVPLSAFVQNGYQGTIIGTGPLNGQKGFINDSPGYGAGAHITSVATLGAYTPGTMLSVRLLTAWDDCCGAGTPSWEIDSLEVLEGGSPTLVDQNFNSGNGGFTVTTPVAFDGPWAYDAVRGSWHEDGQGPENNHPNTSSLNSPAFTVSVAGFARLTFVHRWSFEYDGTAWDGGQVRISVNGGAYVPVDPAAFTAGNYNGTIAAGSASELKGQPGYIAESANYATVYITSVVGLGVFNAGDTISVQFMASADTNTKGATPNWEIDSIVIQEGISLPVMFMVNATAVVPGATSVTINYQWQRDGGAGFVDIAGATTSTYTFFASAGDDGAVYRCLVSAPGVSAISTPAVLTIRGATRLLAIQRTGPTTVVVSWTAPSTGYVLQQASVLLTPATTVWTPVGTVPTVSGGMNRVTITGADAGTKFLRLRSP